MTERKKILLFQLGFVLISMAIIEIVLRARGYQPGNIKPDWSNFAAVDTLREIKFHMNAEGLIVADSAYWASRGLAINADGFRTHDLSKTDPTKKKLLLIGDSFVWGLSAAPVKEKCFAALLQTDTSYQVFNLGIPLADPVQYSGLARKYITQLKPDYVFVFFFMGNDLMQDDRQLAPGKAFYFSTNAGGIAANIDGKQFTTAQQAYEYLLNKKFFLGKPESVIETIAAQSALLSRLYSLRYRVEEKVKFERTVKDTRITKNYLKQIQQEAAKNNVPVKFILIPELKEADMPLDKYTKKYSDLLTDSILSTDWLIFQNSKDNYTPYPDGHLSNKGHQFYANCLQGFLKNVIEPK